MNGFASLGLFVSRSLAATLAFASLITKAVPHKPLADRSALLVTDFYGSVDGTFAVCKHARRFDVLGLDRTLEPGANDAGRSETGARDVIR